MACWPANVVGAFFVVLFMSDLVIGDFDDLPFHSISGILLTVIFWLICATLGESISSAVLIVPLIFLFVFIISKWMIKPPKECPKECPKKEEPCPDKCEEPCPCAT